ncbi:hypothetical protein RSO41_12360 [Halomonas sp. I1]|uniref:hypothetical protein n=1 Tax=Halomonas sp. I1 TaxID=393536 RepID=UPI0028E0519E|nr:hypothetical protein [Halomonas sp. I1]MDT8895449.1 hypothetical protein [Halomonas sp. I1]
MNLIELKRLVLSFGALPLACAGVLVLANVQQLDREVAAEMQRQYCAGVATWQAEARQGVAPERRTGHPDYDGIADEQCPGSRQEPLDHSPARQMASY